MNYGYRWAFVYLPLFNSYTVPLAATFILLASGVSLHIAGLWFKFKEYNTTTVNKKIFNYVLGYSYINGSVFGINHEFYGKLWNIRSIFAQITTSIWITFWLTITILLGIIFTIIQGFEYIYLLPFKMNDSVFGSCFYLLTGFHGLHVIIGTVGLIICLFRHLSNQFTENIHIGFECASWYWHFVDAVWLFVFICIYWWSAPLNIAYFWHTIDKQSFVCGDTTLTF